MVLKFRPGEQLNMKPKRNNSNFSERYCSWSPATITNRTYCDDSCNFGDLFYSWQPSEENHFRKFSISLWDWKHFLVFIGTMVDPLVQKYSQQFVHQWSTAQDKGNSWIFPLTRPKILEHMLLHGLYISMVIAVILLYRKRLFDLQEPR